MKTKTLLSLIATLFMLPLTAFADDPLNGRWVKKDSYGQDYNVLDLSLDQPSCIGAYSEGYMDGISLQFDKIISRSENDVTLGANYGSTAKIKYNPLKKTINIRVYWQGEKTPRVNQTFSEKELINMTISTKDQDIVDYDDEKTVIGKAKIGEMFKWTGVNTYDKSIVLLPNGKKALLAGWQSSAEPIDSFVLGKEYVVADENGKSSLEFELLKDGIVRMVETYMFAPTPNGGIRPALVRSYLGVIKGNRIILTHSAGMEGSYSETLEEFQPMKKAIEVIYITTGDMIFEGKEYDESRH